MYLKDQVIFGETKRLPAINLKEEKEDELGS